MSIVGPKDSPRKEPSESQQNIASCSPDQTNQSRPVSKIGESTSPLLELSGEPSGDPSQSKGDARQSAQPPQTANDQGSSIQAQQASPFLMAVPDYIQADWQRAMPRPQPEAISGQMKRGRQRMGAGLQWAIHQAVIVQKSSRVILPDVVLAQVLWGGEKSCWPRNWRRSLVQRLKRLAASNAGLSKVDHKEVDLKEYWCPVYCPLNGTSIRHQHLEITICTPEEIVAPPDGDKEPEDPDFTDSFLGALEVFGKKEFPDRRYHWALCPDCPEPEDSDEKELWVEHQKLIKKVKALKSKGRIKAVYFPVLLFGPRLGLKWRQRQLHQAILRELTRCQWKQKSDRPDRAEIVFGGRIPVDNASFGVAPCPYLEKGEHYIGFNGNGKRKKRHLHGRGYKLLVWMQKAAYKIPEDKKSLWKQVRAFLQDLVGLADLFGLVIGAWHPKECSWQPLDSLMPLARTSQGRAWLGRCLLRLYTREDFLVRWRRLIAAKMSFSAIPDTIQEQSAEPQHPTASREALLAYLSQKGVTPAELARQLSVSESLVSLHLSGKRAWSAKWKLRIVRWLAQKGEIDGKV